MSPSRRRPPRIARGAALAVAATIALGCSGQVPTPSAYSTQRFLCDAEHEADYAAAVQACAAASCPGVLSMTGTLESEPLTVESTLYDASIVVAQGGSARLLDEVKLSGRSPYFNFIFHLRSVGGDVSVPLTSPKTMPIDVNARWGANRLTAGRVEAGILLEVAGNSSEEHGLTNSGTVTILAQSEKEIVGTFDGSFATTPNRLRGCFHVFPDHEIVNPLGAQ